MCLIPLVTSQVTSPSSLNLVHLFVHLHLNYVYHLHDPSLAQHIPDLIGDLPGGLVDQQTPTD